MGLFGGGNSASSTTTETLDAKIATSGGAFAGINQTGSGNRGVQSGAVATIADIGGTGNTVQILDAGAVSQSLSLAMKGVEMANATANTAVQRSGELLSGIFDSQSSTNKSLAGAVVDVKGSDVRVLVIGALAIVAGLFVFMRKG